MRLQSKASAYFHQMKRIPCLVIGFAIVAALVAMHLLLSRLPISGFFSGARNSWYTETLHKEETKHRETIQETPASFTCSSKTSAIMDSSGKWCLNLTGLMKGQKIYSYHGDDLSYLYCGIPKNGCTYHIGIMHRLMGFEYEGGINVHNPANKQRVFPDEDALDLLKGDIKRYAIVRNPLQRVLSGYLNKVEHFYKNDAAKSPETFRKWVYKELRPAMSWNGVNPHWRAQVEFCGFKIRDLSSYFTLFYVEKPEDYVNYMEDFLPEWVLRDGWENPLNKSFREYVLGPRTRTEHTSERFLDYVGDMATFDYLRDVYMEDIMAFDYEDEVSELTKELAKRMEKKQ